MQGFVPKRPGPFVSAKVPKTISARARPLWGNFAARPNQMARKLAPLKQSSPKCRIRPGSEAALEGGGKYLRNESSKPEARKTNPI
jgi:hypothetical protein